MHTCTSLYIYMGGGRVSVCMYVYFGFSVSKLSRKSTPKTNNLLEGSSINTINECA